MPAAQDDPSAIAAPPREGDDRGADGDDGDAKPLSLDAMFPQTLHRLPDGVAFILWISGAIVVPIILVYVWRAFFPPEY
jgi:hypothetical protein